MSRTTSIPWTQSTWNPVRGCSQKSAGCLHCYAARMALRFSGKGKPYEGLVEHGPRWTGRVEVASRHLEDPLHWEKPRMIFVNSMGDTFHEEVGVDIIQGIMDVMLRARQHIYQILTKRTLRMSEILPHLRRPGGYKWMDMQAGNIWIGTTVENRQTAEERIPLLTKTPAAIRFLSCEPLLESLGPLDLRGISWVIAGCESGPGARPMDLAWVRDLRDQCMAQNVKFFLKQAHVNGKLVHLPFLDDRQWTEIPIA